MEDIKPSKNLPLLAPLRLLNQTQSDYDGIKIRLFKIKCIGYNSPKTITVKMVDEKSYNLNATMSEKKKSIHRDKYQKANTEEDENLENLLLDEDSKSWMFGSIKNPELGGDFEISIHIGKQKLSAWLNVPFMVQIAEISQNCEKEKNEKACLDLYLEENMIKSLKSLKRGSVYSRKSETEVPDEELEDWCQTCKINYYHYQFLHVEKCSILKDPLDINSWEKKVQRI